MSEVKVAVSPIKTEADHKAALARIDALMDAKADTPEADELSVLADLVEAYEAKHFPIAPPDLKIVGEIKPPEVKDSAQMLRAIANDIEAGDLGSVLTVAVALKSKEGHRVFGAGALSSLEHIALLFSAAASQMNAWVWNPANPLLKEADQ